MDTFKNKEEELRRREEELRARELQVRMKELEKEIDGIPVQPTTKHQEPATSAAQQRRFIQKVSDIGKFCLIVISVIVAIRLAAWLGTILLVLGITWMAYKLFLDKQ